MPSSPLVPSVRSLPPIPRVAGTGAKPAPPVFVGELAVRDIRPGSTLTVTTENHIYTVNMSENGKGMLMTNNTDVANGFIILHGAWDLEKEQPCWGALQRGMGLLFAHIPDVKSATKTSAVQKITLVRRGL